MKPVYPCISRINDSIGSFTTLEGARVLGSVFMDVAGNGGGGVLLLNLYISKTLTVSCLFFGQTHTHSFTGSIKDILNVTYSPLGSMW